MEQQREGAPAKRRRDADASRAAILEAASEVFNERGYTGATIREIARRAGVTHGLVMRHFGSKEQLLIQALPGPRMAAEVAPGDLDTLPERIAAAFVAQTEPDDAGTSFAVALIRSAGAGEGAAMPLYAAAEHEITAALRQVLGPGSEVYANLLSSLVIGVTFTRHIGRTGAIAELTPDELTGYLAAAIRGVLAPAITAAKAAHGALPAVRRGINQRSEVRERTAAMSYTPRHAKPASAKDIALSAYHGAFGSTEASSGRHARPQKGDHAASGASGTRIPLQRVPDASETQASKPKKKAVEAA